MGKILSFSGTILKNIYNSEGFKVYAVDVDTRQFPDIQKNNFGNVSICGDLSELSIDVEYEITGEETSSKNGISYKVTNIKRNVPMDLEDTLNFLTEILTFSQAETLVSAYPDIIQRVRENRLDDIDLTKTKGIKQFTFEKIKEKIIDNFCLCDLVVEFKGCLTLNMIKKIYNKYTSIEKVREEIRNNPYKCICGLSGVGFKTADAIVLKLDKDKVINFNYDIKTSPERCFACLHYILEENENNGHTKMNLIECRKQLINLVPECSDHFADVIKYDEIYYNKEKLEIALAHTMKIEAYLASVVLKATSVKNEWDCINVEKYRNISGSICLSDEQLSLLPNVCKNNIEILTSCAGTGKSTAVKALVNMLEDYKKNYVMFTPTGRSAKVLQEASGRQASTIHRGLGYQPPNTWTYNEENKLSADIVIVDEFSMIDIYLCKKLFEAIDFDTTKLLIIGDSAQLPSVSAGNVLHDLVESEMIHTTRLSTVFRYQDGGVMKVATDVRNEKPFLSNSMKNTATKFGNDYMFVDVPKEKIISNVVGLYKKLLQNGCSVNDISILTAMNKGEYGTVAINKLIQQVANRNYGSSINIKSGETTYYVGDIVIQRVNNYKAKLAEDEEKEIEKSRTAFVANGEIGIVENIGSNFMDVNFDGILVRYYCADLLNLSLGYSISCHKSQGSSIKTVILLTPPAHVYFSNSNLIYVGITRTKEKCYHIGSVNAVNQSVIKKADTSRDTFLLDFLKDIPF